MPKIANVTISDLAVDTWLTAMLKTGFESNSRPYRVMQGLPEDAKLVGVDIVEGQVRAIRMFFESDSFPDVALPQEETSLTITVERIP